MKIKNFLVLPLFALGLLVSCSSDDDNGTTTPEQPGSYSEGYFILNEGNFGSGNTTISHLDLEQGTVELDVYAPANDGAALGDVGQSMGFYKDYAFVVLNVSNKVEVVNLETFESVASIDQNLNNPRYIAFADGKAYVTNWGDGGNPDDDFIAVIDLETFEVESSISVGEGPEEIVAHNGKLYVNLIGGWNFNDILAVVDPLSGQVEKEINVGALPNSLEISNGYAWVAAGGFPDYSEQESAGMITSIDLQTLEIAQQLEFPELTNHPYNLEVENGQVYYSLGTTVYSIDTHATALAVEPLMQLAEVSVLRSMKVFENNLFVTSANSDFTGDGKLLIYDLETQGLMESFDVGINPNGVYRE